MIFFLILGKNLSYVIYRQTDVLDFLALKVTDSGLIGKNAMPEHVSFQDNTKSNHEILHFQRGTRNWDYVIFVRDFKSLLISRCSNGTLGTYEQPKKLLSQEGCRGPSLVQDSKGNNVLIWGNTESPYNIHAAGLLWQSDGWPIVVDFPVKKDKPESVREYPSFRKNHLLYLLAGSS